MEMEAVMSEVEIPWWEYHKNVQARVRVAHGNIHAHSSMYKMISNGHRLMVLTHHNQI